MRLFWQTLILRAPEGETGAAPSASGGEPSSGSPTPSGDSGGSGAPAAASPEPTAPSTPSSPAPVSDDVFEFPADVTDEGYTDEEVVLQPEVPQQPVTQPEVPPVAPQAVAPTTPEVPAAPTGTAPQQPSLTPADPMGIARVMRENEPALIEHLAQTEFALSPEDIQGLEEDAVSYTPKLLAKTYVRMQQNMMAQLARVVPAMLSAHSEISKRSEKSESTFFERWPGLKKEEYLPQVRQAAQMYRRMNPNVSKEEMIEELGQILSIRLKVPLTAVPSPRPTAPQGQRPVHTSPPFRPAMGGPASVPSQPESSPWDGLGQDFEG